MRCAKRLTALARAQTDKTKLRGQALAPIKSAFQAARGGRARVRHGRHARRARRRPRALRPAGRVDPRALRLRDQAFLLCAEPDRGGASRRRRHGRLRPRRARARLRHRPALRPPDQAQRLVRERDRVRPAHAVGSGAEGRARGAHAGRMRAPGAHRRDHPHRPARGALSRRRPRALRGAAPEVLERERRLGPRLRRRQARRSATSATPARAQAAIWSSPTSRRARAGCATCRRSIGSANISTAPTTPSALVAAGVFTQGEFETFQRAEAFPVGRARAAALSRRPRRGAAVLRPAARARGPAGFRRRHAAPRGGGVHEGLFPGRQGRRRPHPHLLRRAGGAEPQAQAHAVAPPARLPQAAQRGGGFLRRERTG